MASAPPLQEADLGLESPRKRQKLDSPPPSISSIATTTTQPIGKPVAKMDEPMNPMVISETGFQPEREKQCAIIHFVNDSNPGFTGVLKQRYTDFIVNEIALDGSVIHLTNDRAPNFKAIIQDEAPSSSKPAQDTTSVPTASKPDDNGEGSAKDVKPDEAPPPGQAISDEVVAPAPAGSKPEQSPITSVEKPSEGTQKPAFVLSSEDDKTLVQYFGAAFKDELVKFHEKILAKPEAKPAVFGSLLSSPITDRVLRGQIHQNIRRIFDSKIETTLIEDDVIKFTAALPVKPHPEGYVRRQNPRQQRSGPKGKLGWQELGGEYLHFSLYKENKNTLEVTSFLSRKLHVKPKEFGFAGTKDRRAATVQRVSIKRQYADRLASLNRELRNARVGDFKYEKHGLELGDLQGNEFTITLRDCHFGNDFHLEEAARVQFANDVVGQAVEHLKVHGFINYFGLQRFGTFDIGTDEVGKKILKEDYEGAVWAILSFNEEILAAEPNPEARGSDKIASDFIYRARAIDLFKKTGKYQSLPQAFSAEQAIIRHLSSGQKSKDYLGAIMAITRNMRTLYPHAYQSLVWNTVASERWSRYRDRVIKGDLVIIDTEAKKAAARQDEVDENGEVVVHPAEDDVGLSYEDLYQRARPLTAEEADSGKYTIFDIVLPTPGFDVEYPDNDIGDFYKEFMGSERGGGLDPAKMRRNQKDFSLSGSYRKFLGQVGKNLSFQIRTYHEDTEQLVETDLDRLNKSRPNYQRYGSQYQNSGPQNGRGRGARYDNSAGQHGGRQNGNWSNQQNGPNNDNAQQPPPSTGSTSGPPTPAVHPNLAAWQNLPAKLAADDAAAAAAYELRKPANPDDIKQPIYKETFVETSVINNEGRRTGYRSTKYIGADGQELTKEEADAINAANAKIDAKAEAMELDASNAAFNAATWTSAETPTPAPGLPRKRSAGDMSSAAAEPAKPMGLSMDGAWDSFEYRGPAKIGVIIKFTLGPSMYATMALRELMKAGGVKTYKPDFSSGA